MVAGIRNNKKENKKVRWRVKYKRKNDKKGTMAAGVKNENKSIKK